MYRNCRIIVSLYEKVRKIDEISARYVVIKQCASVSTTAWSVLNVCMLTSVTRHNIGNKIVDTWTRVKGEELRQLPLTLR